MDVFWIGAETLNCGEHKQKCGLAGDTSGFFFFVRVLAAGKKEGGAIVIGYGSVKTELETLQQQHHHPSAAEDGEDGSVILGCLLLNIKLQYIH